MCQDCLIFETGAWHVQAEDAQVLTHANIGGLLNSKQSTKGIFWDVVWPQLAKAGWTSDQVPLKPSGCIFFPPSTPSGQPPPLDSIPVRACASHHKDSQTWTWTFDPCPVS